MYRILCHYLEAHAGVQGQEELLNPHFGSYEMRSGKLAVRACLNQFQTSAAASKVFAERLGLAKDHYGKLFFKVFPSAFRHEALAHLRQYEFVAHERRDHWQQALSFLVGLQGGRWYEDTPTAIPPRSLAAELENFRRIEASLFHYYQLKTILKPRAVFTYEELLAKTPAALLQSHGFTLPFDEQALKLPRKQNPDDKLALFKNGPEIQRWYRDSFLQQVSPLP